MKKRLIPRQGGFTLIEMMVVVAVIGILASIAYPSYREFVAKAKRADVAAMLSSAQQWMERFYSENFRYDKSSAGVAVTDSTQFPKYFSVSPMPGQGSAVYDVTVVVTDGTRDVYSLKAVRKAGSSMAGDRCGDYYLDQYGRKELKNFSSKHFATKQDALNYCWK
ncbi:Fimbrial protein|jgi:type IV pilus assembly protein PilE|uniref:type IV pilin protein n=1 Tax=Delftia TaxID=80865 RepID=UPI0011538B4D|nr:MULTISPECIES: type IV pilin protein [Delftia]MCA1068720.1 Fimbrial protein [Delftia acidovorans]TQL71906.1 type IV pilus assembly protein PilE [Delftia sp. HK171]